MRVGKLAALFAATALWAFGAAPAYAGIVTFSSGPSASRFAVGSEVADGERITLRAGDRLTVLSNSGTREMRGPGTFQIARNGAATNHRVWEALSATRVVSRDVVAATRSPASWQSPNLWWIDVDSGLSVSLCVPEGETIRFWRRNPDVRASYALASTSRPNRTTALAFAGTETIADWGPTPSPQASQSYRITRDSGELMTQINLVFLSLSEIASPEALAPALLAHGCTNQLEMLTLALSEG